METSHEAVEVEIGLWMALITADGVVTEEELDAIVRAATHRFGDTLGDGTLSTLAVYAQQRIEQIGARAYVDELIPRLPKATGRAIIDAAIDIACSDGMTIKERELLVHVGRALGLGDEAIPRAIKP